LPFLITVAAVYAGICLLVFVFQPKLIFMPTRDIIGDPREIGCRFEDVTVKDASGESIHGWFVGHEAAKATVVFCHGNAGNISYRLETLQLLHGLGLAVLIFDYPGYGNSSGSPSEQGIDAAADAMWRYLVEQRRLAPEDIIIWGRSLGGAVAVGLAARHSPKALIVESTFTSIGDMAARLYPWLPVRILSRFSFDAASKVATLGFPKLFVHSREDDIVPFALGKRLFEAAAEPKQFVEIEGFHDGGFLESGEKYLTPVRAFLDSL